MESSLCIVPWKLGKSLNSQAAYYHMSKSLQQPLCNCYNGYMVDNNNMDYICRLLDTATSSGALCPVSSWSTKASWEQRYAQYPRLKHNKMNLNFFRCKKFSVANVLLKKIPLFVSLIYTMSKKSYTVGRKYISV